MYEMKEEYFTGIELIDKEHAKLFQIAETVYQLLHDELIPDKYDHIRQVLVELRDYTVMHFEHEEEYMKSIQYKRMFMQKVEHDAFIHKIEDLEFDKLDENQDETIHEILKFLTDWLVQHILENDKLIGQ